MPSSLCNLGTMVHVVTAPRAPEVAASGTESTLWRVVISSPAAKGVISPLPSTKLQIWKPCVSFYLTLADSPAPLQAQAPDAAARHPGRDSHIRWKKLQRWAPAFPFWSADFPHCGRRRQTRRPTILSADGNIPRCSRFPNLIRAYTECLLHLQTPDEAAHHPGR